MRGSCTAMMHHPPLHAWSMDMPFFWGAGSFLLSFIVLVGVAWLLGYWLGMSKAAPTEPTGPVEWRSSFAPYERGYRPLYPEGVIPDRSMHSNARSASWDEQPQTQYPPLPPNRTGEQE